MFRVLYVWFASLFLKVCYSRLIETLQASLNPYTEYKLMVSDTVLQNKEVWGIM